ncbi:MAG: Flp pilus assembly protein CpaB [Candidatus Dormibacteria bacterium]
MGMNMRPGGRPNKLIAIVVGLIVAGAGAVGLIVLTKAGGGGANVPTVTVVEAATEIPNGSAITQSEVVATQVPTTAVPAGAFTDPTKVVGQYAIVSIVPNQVITPSLVSPTKTSGIAVVCTPQATASPTLITSISPSSSPSSSSSTTVATQAGCREEAFSLPSGYVAIAIPMNATQGVGGFLQPGDQIDILGDANGQGNVEIMAHNVTILNVGTVGQTAGAATELIVGVPESEAELLSYLMDSRNSTQSSILEYVLLSNTNYVKFGTSPSPSPDQGMNSGSFQALFH